MPKFFSNGKLLITGEYAVLDGALSLAVPTKVGQGLQVSEGMDGLLHWESLDKDGSCWFKTQYTKKDLDNLNEGVHEDPRAMLQKILTVARTLNPSFLRPFNGFIVESKLEFDRKWGLGSSSTLVNNIAQWANVNAFALLSGTFGGSGYDIACAQNNTPITYQLVNGNPSIQQVPFNPPFKDTLFFVHLNTKQNSRNAIEHYNAREHQELSYIKDLSEITKEVIGCAELESFEKLLNEHERILETVLGIPRIQTSRFSDYPGVVKSLGAWGGDFVLATGADPANYFKKKGYHTVIPYTDLVLRT